MSMNPSATLEQENAGPPHRRLPAAAAAVVLLCAALLPMPDAYAQTAPARTRARTPAPRAEPVTLNFVNADIEGVARAMSAILNQQFVVDPRVKGTMTLYRPPTSTTVKPRPRSAARKFR